jgi:hypothetical protein
MTHLSSVNNAAASMEDRHFLAPLILTVPLSSPLELQAYPFWALLSVYTQ